MKRGRSIHATFVIAGLVAGGLAIGLAPLTSNAQPQTATQRLPYVYTDWKHLTTKDGLPNDHIFAIKVHGDDVWVGRIRKDESTRNALWMWVVTDNVRKGAALNAVQIAELVVDGLSG